MSGSARPWLSARRAAMRLEISVYEIFKLAVAGAVRTLSEPGQTPKFSAEDVEKLAAERELSASA